MYTKLAIVPFALAALASDAPSARQASTCKPGFRDTVYNVLLEDNPGFGWKYNATGISGSPVLFDDISNELTAPTSSWHVWPNNGSSPDWTFSTALFERLNTCAGAPFQAPNNITTGGCINPSTGFAFGTFVFSIECDTCLGINDGGLGCVITNPFVPGACVSAPSPDTGTVMLRACDEDGVQDKWDIQVAV
ncbi:hypothetical protein VKT23_008281 [Stygiomarasmius scandens]|uniref:Uncharacterized protein n=1 Tax=Marasmiellus scandens TaxID=2682957 RepID=A0ABR1JHS8_9AGAR